MIAPLQVIRDRGEVVGAAVLDEALDDLEQRDARMARIVKLRFFAGLTVEETARSLDVSTRTVNRDWTAGRVWLHRRISGADDVHGH